MQTTVRNILSLNLSTIFANFAAFITSVVIGRYLGKADFGRFIFIFAFISLFDVFTDLGLSQLATKEVSRNNEEAGRYLINLSFLKSVLCIITIISIWLIAKLLGFSQDINTGLLIIGVSLIIESFGRFFGYLFNAFERMEYTGVFSFLLKFFTLMGVFWAVKLHFGLTSIYAVYALSALIFSSITFIFLKRKFIPALPALDFSFCKEIALKGLPFALFAFLWIIYSRVDVSLLKFLKGEEATAIYGAANYILMALMFIPANLSAALYPIFSRLYDNGENSRKELIGYYQKSFFYLLILALPIGLGITLLSEKIVLFIWTKKYIESALALKILIWRVAIQYLTSVLTFMLFAIDKQKIMTIFMFFLVLINVFLNLMLIPAYNYTGASISALVSMVLYFILTFGYVSKHLYRIKFRQVTVKPFIAAAFLGVFIHIFQKANLFIVVSMAAGFYFSVLFLLGGLKVKEA